jgi:hypothetical protein
MLIEIFKTMLGSPRSFFQSRAALLAENAVLRQQIVVLRRSVPKPRIRARGRVVLALAARVFGSVLRAITIVRPATVVRWHRSSWRLIWRKRSGRPVERLPADADPRGLIRRFWKENPLWGEDKIAAELGKLGYRVSPRTVAKYRPPYLPRNRGQSWPTFVRNHLHQTWACDFLTIATLRFQWKQSFGTAPRRSTQARPRKDSTAWNSELMSGPPIALRAIGARRFDVIVYSLTQK